MSHDWFFFFFCFREKKMVEINFLCVHKKLRSKRVAPVLIREITRRVNLQGIFQAVYTAGVVLPKPVGTCRWVWQGYFLTPSPRVRFHSLLKLVLNDVSFVQVLASLFEPSKTNWSEVFPSEQEHDYAADHEVVPLARGCWRLTQIFSHFRNRLFLPACLLMYSSLSSLFQAPKTSGLRPMTKKDVPVVHRLLREYLSQFNLVPVMNQEEVEHWLLPQENIIDTYVVEVKNPEKIFEGKKKPL